MSDCQKHTNHHCAHSHHCKDPAHKKKNTRTYSATQQSKHPSSAITHKYHPPMGTIADNEECHFVSSGISSQPSNLHIEAFAKQINSLHAELQLSNNNFLTSDIENRKLRQRNSHLECQIEYLRQQLEVLVSNHNTDIHKEIKKSLIEHTQLNIKIKELTTALFDKQKSLEQISSEHYSLNRKNKQLQVSLKSIEEKTKIITIKNEDLSFQNTSLKNKINQLQAELKLLKSRYSTLATSADRSEKEKETKLSGFQNEKEKLERTYKAKDSQLKRLKQLHQVEKKAWQKMIAELKENLAKKDEECKRNRQIGKQAEESLMKVREDLDHAKKMILKYEKVNGECQKFKEQTKQILTKSEAEVSESEKKTISKIQMPQKSVEDQNLLRVEQVQKLNRELEEKIRELEKRLTDVQPLQNRTNNLGGRSSLQPQCTVINEELILSIGASEQFKKIVQQKNGAIKKLMREKAELHNKIYELQSFSR